MTPITWTGDLNDDCTAEWEGLVLRAERMVNAAWWWEVTDGGEVVDGSNERGMTPTTGPAARVTAEAAARAYRAGIEVDE